MRTTNRRSPTSAANASSRCAPRRWRCSTPTAASPTCGAAASTCTTSGATRSNPRGLWRRTTLDEYRTDDPDWDVLIDLDELAAPMGENWVWAGADVIEPDLTLALI